MGNPNSRRARRRRRHLKLNWHIYPSARDSIVKTKRGWRLLLKTELPPVKDGESIEIKWPAHMA